MILSNINNNNKAIKLLIISGFILSFYFFSRFTVDDAFISWRYGFNLISSGHWNYNPSSLDLTQAYTNPLFAFLSILPAYFNIDVVLFFKILSLSSMLLFIFYMKKKHDMLFETLLFLSIPAFMIHAFSGLETVFFTFFLVTLYDNLNEHNIKKTVITTCLLFLIRPESFLLTLLVPLYFLSKKGELNFFLKIKEAVLNKDNYKAAILSFSLLSTVLFITLYLHKIHFGQFLPNTFYVKSAGLEFNFHIITTFIKIIPALALSFLLISKKNTSLFYVFFILFLAMSINYSISNLQMDYNERFAFHIYSPLYFMLLISSKEDLTNLYMKIKHYSLEINIKYLTAFLLSIIFFTLQFKPKEIFIMAEYYPRLLTAHTILGKIIAKSSAKSMSFGDAGTTAFNAGVNSLDNIGLGSQLVAKNGVNDFVIGQYNPDIILLHSRPETGIRINDHNQQGLFKWAKHAKMSYVCDVISRKDYSIAIFVKNSINQVPFKSLCRDSQKNLASPTTTFVKYVIPPPWRFWHN